MSKHTTHIIDGTAIADHWLADIAAQVRALGAPLHLAAVCASDEPGLKTFVKLKQKAAQKAGIVFSAYYPETELEARQTALWLAKDDSVHGIFVELPLPDGWDRAGLLGLIPLFKDVDVIAPEDVERFHHGDEKVLPPAVAALARLFAVRSIEPRGMAVGVIGQGDLVGKPVAQWLRRQGSDVSVIDVGTEHPERIASEHDLLVCGAGVPGLVTADWVKEGAVVIDFGYARQGDAYVGDAAASAMKKAGELTPVPGGMGPLVIAATLENLLILATK